MEMYRKGSHSLFELKIHLVWITKYRKPVLLGQVALRVRELVRKICADLDVEILAGNIRRDHVYLLLSYRPELSISKLVQKLKGVTCRKLLQEIREFRQEFWGRGYFVVSSGNVTDEVIAAYIRDQDEVESRRRSDNFIVGF